MEESSEAQGHLYRRAAPARQSEDRSRPHHVQPGGSRHRSSEQQRPQPAEHPIRTELGREIRRAFIAEPGTVLISADYSQIELRVLAHLSGDETLIDAFKRGDDIHDQTVSKVFGSDSGLDPHELRRRAKIVNYALLYGKTAFTLARDIGVTQQAAQAFIDAYFEGFPAVRTYIDQVIEDARETGVVKTMLGRRRLVPELTSRNGRLRAAAERVTVNMPIQGTAADILKRAMIDIQPDLPKGALMILTVHDELLFEVPEPQANTIVDFVRNRMEGAAALAVPLTVDIGVGRTGRTPRAETLRPRAGLGACRIIRALVEPNIIPRADHPVSRDEIDPDALKVLYRLRRFNHDAYLVGGGVRDLLLGRTPKDFDIGTSARPSEVKRSFATVGSSVVGSGWRTSSSDQRRSRWRRSVDSSPPRKWR